VPIPDKARAKNPVKVRAGKLAAVARWGERRHVNLAELDPDTARLIRALLAQSPTRHEEAASGDQTPAAAGVGGGTSNATPTD
jgi:hypothetical protein